MASRAVWKGYVRFSLVSIPVQAFTAASSEGGKVALNQLHKDCGSRIKYSKTCPVHGELKADEIVSGYQFAENQYVTIDPDEVSKLIPKSEKSIGIESFIPADKVDPRYYSGRTLYLTPDGPIGKKPYALLQRLLQEEGRMAFATGVFSKRDQLMIIRPINNLLAATFLSFESELKPISEFESQAGGVEIDKKELDLARTLVNQLASDELDLSQYKDTYADNLQKLVEAKVAGQEIIAAPVQEEPSVVNLMEALQRSIDAAKSKARPAKLAAPSSAQKRAAGATGAKKRKQA